MNLEKEFVPYQESLELKELGFDEPCFGYYTEDKMWRPASYSYEGTEYPWNSVWPYTTAPTFSQAFRWFREKYGLYSWITMELGATLTFCWIITGENKSTEHKAFFKSYEEAEEACLIELINICKKK